MTLKTLQEVSIATATTYTVFRKDEFVTKFTVDRKDTNRDRYIHNLNKRDKYMTAHVLFVGVDSETGNLEVTLQTK